ncbi:MAG: hypothetical protein JWM65_2119 [Sphingomonas bacterium]|nr:hypothetical protein [Sphingomonas bacterium]
MLLLILVTLPIALDVWDVPDWLRLLPYFLLCLPAYILLCVLTYRRLRNAWLAGGWIALMIIVTHVGPGWHVSSHVDFRLGDMIGLIPILLAWFAPARWGSNPLAI